MRCSPTPAPLSFLQDADPDSSPTYSGRARGRCFPRSARRGGGAGRGRLTSVPNLLRVKAGTDPQPFDGSVRPSAFQRERASTGDVSACRPTITLYALDFAARLSSKRGVRRPRAAGEDVLGLASMSEGEMSVAAIAKAAARRGLYGRLGRGHPLLLPNRWTVGPPSPGAVTNRRWSQGHGRPDRATRCGAFTLSRLCDGTRSRTPIWARTGPGSTSGGIRRSQLRTATRLRHLRSIWMSTLRAKRT